MPKGPNGQKRPADAIARAIMVAQIATGEIAEETTANTKRRRDDGKAGGLARAITLTPEQRREIARTAADARWKKS